MKFEFIKNRKLYWRDEAQIVADMLDFTKKYKIKLNKITVDLRKTKNEYNSKGIFGGFKDLYDARKKSLYFNPYEFVEYQERGPILNLVHLLMHEAVHVKQLQSGEMKILGPNKLKFKNKIYDKAPFSVDLFNRLREKTPELAEEYHWRTLPWEKDAYKLPEKFMGRPLWKAL